MVKRAATIWAILAVLATVPVLAMDFDSWRSDGSIESNSSVNQQSSNTGFNLLENLFDALSGSFGLSWVGEHQENGGRTSTNATLTLRYGDLPPTEALKDTRPQDPVPDWASWPVVQNLSPVP